MSSERSFRITGMHCPACEALVAEEVGNDPHVVTARARRNDDRLWVELNSDVPDDQLKDRWNQRLDPLGYRLWLETEDPAQEVRRETLGGLAAGGVVLAVLAWLQTSGLVETLAPTSLELPGAFLLGLLASVSSCFALVGGLLISYTAAVGRSDPRAVGPGLALFHGTRLTVFFVGGGLLGLVGQAVGDGADLQRVLLTVAAVVMASLGLSLLGVKVPGLGGMPQSLGRARSAARWGSLGGGALLGTLTFFLPCGFTQSVQFQALASGDFLSGGLLTLVFALGTLPVLTSVGWLIGRGLVGRRRAIVLKAGGTLVLGLGLFQLWGVLQVWGIRF